MDLLLIFIVILLIVSGVYLLLISPARNGKKKFREATSCKFFAHRGLYDNNGNSPENSLGAFKHAIEKGYGIELDVQLSSDGKAVVFHDDNLLRVCGINGKVCEYTFTELSQMKLFNSEEKIPSFKKVLELINGSVPVIVEIKSENSNITICIEIKKLLDTYKGVYFLQSFNPLAIRFFKKHDKNTIRGQLASSFMREKNADHSFLFFCLSHLLLNRFSNPSFIAFDIKYRNAISFNVCRILGAMSVGWVITSAEELKKSKTNYDVFIFENFFPTEKELI